ncbi:MULTISPECIES: multidrug effflux MFS transporter [Gluconobacter]|mgnify:FL=1|uniref:Bcr/CflA family efflux transporter n=1 Tax=Gluconobacter cerinus TaxID=38307 RepID=A0A1B6VFS3_9PROT|nr:multidrug effflux MFS transporter [Gluconobacter cerinus]MBS1030532.1 multidrug effflux MFS transporter [Gluconobacter cerinus]MBS1033196.1 multidrug effflux MFS transporter [Gluconobacter cerinus]OAJ66050.1 Bcr/CflA family drug resistance efflux transporter [Gluconobacter cerinus]
MTEQSMAFRRGDTIPGWLPLMLGIFTAVGPVSTDIYLPALPEMERQLHSAPGSGSITMAAWVIGLAIGQITIGPVSDRFGRRLPLLIGMIGYTIGEIGCALAPTMTIMCICRVFSALMASAGLVIPNACLRDLTEGDEASRLMSRLIVVQGVVPILAPMLGGFALKFVDWRVIFWATAVYGGLCTLMLLTVFPETLPTQERRDMRPLSIIERYIYILRTRSFITNGLVWSFLGFVTFTYLTGAPTLFEERFGMSPFHYGMLFGLFAVCMIGASAINGLVVGKVSTTHMLFSALGISLTGSILFLALAVISAVDLTAGGQLRSFFLWPLIISLVITMAPTGIIGPNSMVGILSEQSERAGSASALAGTMQYLFGAVASALFGLMSPGTAIPFAGFLVFAFCAATVFALLRPRLPSSAP